MPARENQLVQIQESNTVIGVMVWIAGCALTLIGAVNIDLQTLNQLGFFGDAWPLLMGLLLLVTQVIARLTRPDLQSLRFHLSAPVRSTVGDVVLHELRVENCGHRWTVPIKIDARSNGFSDYAATFPAIEAGGTARVLVLRRAFWRAHVRSHSYAIAANDRFGLWQIKAWYEVKQHLVIEPRLVDVSVPATMWFGGEDDGARADRSGVQPFAVRPWQFGDSARQVHWRSTARRGELIVMERAIPHEPRLALLMLGDGVTPASEQLVSEFASVGVDAVREGRRVMLLGRQDALPFVDWAGRDTVVDWSVGIASPSLADRADLEWAIRTAGAGAEILVWTTVDMGDAWWAYLNRLGDASGSHFLRGRDVSVVA